MGKHTEKSAEDKLVISHVTFMRANYCFGRLYICNCQK